MISSFMVAVVLVTSTLQLAFIPLASAVISAVPACFPTTLPFFTVATD